MRNPPKPIVRRRLDPVGTQVILRSLLSCPLDLWVDTRADHCHLPPKRFLLAGRRLPTNMAATAATYHSEASPTFVLKPAETLPLVTSNLILDRTLIHCCDIRAVSDNFERSLKLQRHGINFGPDRIWLDLLPLEGKLLAHLRPIGMGTRDDQTADQTDFMNPHSQPQNN